MRGRAVALAGWHCVVFLGKTLYSHSASQPWCINGYRRMYCWGYSCSGLASHPGGEGVEILLVASCYGNRDKLRPNGPLGSNADFTM